MTKLPEPLTPPDCNLRGLRWMPLDVQRVLDSDLFLISSGAEFKAAFALWAKSWSQVPAGSLPNDERILAGLSAAKDWKRVREVALRGWILCADGRLYHPVIAEKALEAMSKREDHAEREENEQSRQQRLRARRKAMFEQLRERGIVPAYDTKTAELERLIASLPSVTPETPSVTTGDASDVTGDAPPTAKDSTGHNRTVNPRGTVIATGKPTRGGRDDFTPKNEGDWQRYFREQHGVELDATSLHDRKKAWPLFAKWAKAGVTTAQMDAAIAKAHDEATDTIAFLPAYADRVLASMSKPERLNPDQQRRAISEANARAFLDGDGIPDPNTIDMEH